METKKEIEALEAQLRGLRIKKKDLDSAISKDERKIIELQGKAEAARKLLSGELDKKKALALQNSLVSDEIKDKKAEIAQDIESLARQRRIVDEDAKNIVEDRKKLEDEVIRLHDEQRKMKDQRSVLDKESGKLDHQKATLENYRIVKEAEINSIKIALSDDNALLQQKLDDVARQVDKANELEEKLNRRLTETEHSIKQAEATKKEYENALKETEAQEIRLLEDEDNARKEWKKAKDLQESLERQLIELGNRDKELKIRELRVQKLIRDKNIDAELKRLEDSVK